MLLRQGDILIQAMDDDSIPSGYQKVDHLVLATGEATGHLHEVQGEAQLFRSQDVQEIEQMFLAVEQEVEVTHPEHDSLILPPGNYKVLRQRQWVAGDAMQVGD